MNEVSANWLKCLWRRDPLNMPPKPVSILAAETHREAMKVRRIQEATAEEKGLPNGWEGVEADPSFDYDQWVVDNAEPFKFSCSPLELSELGPGVVLYFDLVKYLGVLMFCFSALHLVAIYFNSEADVEILEGDAHNWGGAGEGDFSVRDALGLDEAASAAMIPHWSRR